FPPACAIGSLKHRKYDCGLIAVELMSYEIGSNGAPKIAFQLLSLQLLKMRGLREQEQLVDRADVNLLDPAEVDAHAKVAEQAEHFFGGHQPGAAQRAQGAAYLV